MKFALAMVILFSLSSALANPGPQQREARAISDLVKAAKTLAATELSCHTDKDCSFAEYGNRPCGGPQGGIILSSNNLNADEVRFLADQSSDKERNYNKKWGIMSICIAPRLPVPKCVEHVCKDGFNFKFYQF